MPECRILALPVDGRPVTREQVQLLAGIAGCELLCPAVEDLGYFRESADRDFLMEWVERNADQVDGFIFSLDMLVYGGLVPSRFIEDELDSLIARLEVLRRLKQSYPEKPLYAFCATMRLSNNNENEEEKLYWANHGSDIWAWSFYSDRFDCLGDSADMQKAEQARAKIPPAIQRDYLDTRARNFSVTQQALALVEQGIIDRLILPQDDTAEFGFNIAERRRLQQWLAQRGLHEQVLIYPGADEVIYTLLVHQLQRLHQLRPLRLALDLHHPHALEKMVARYEDRPVLESIRCQIHAAGAELAPSAEDADAVIAVHCRGHMQGDWAMQQALGAELAMDAQWLAGIEQSLADQTGKPLALLDLAYANGADPQLITLLADAGLQNLQAYAGWNTASNSIGSLVAQVCAAVGCNSRACVVRNRQLLAIRLLDDYLYQSRLRQDLRQRQKRAGSADGDLALLEEIYLPQARRWLQEQGFRELQLKRVYFPWARSFEVGLSMEVAECSESAAKPCGVFA